MAKLTEEAMIKIIKDKKINTCTSEERKEIMEFAFGKKFMASNDKGKLKKYKEQSNEV
tara:strand:- start:469 stop:642 length:174 start_codon:yes stop_codon:yes gene_type:complete